MKTRKSMVIRFIFIGLVLSVFVFSQVPASRSAWRDFRVFIGIMDDADSQIQQLYNQLINIESEKAEIVDDAERLTELMKIIDIHPDYAIEDIVTKLNKLKVLRQHLENNGYIQ